MLIRVGVAPSTDDVPPATPRRPVDEVLIVRHNSQAKPRRPVDLRWRNEDCGAHPLRDTLSQLRLRELLIEVQDRVEQIVKGAVSSWIRAGLAAAACAASSKPSDSGSSSTSTSTASASQTSCGSSGGTNLSGSADGEMRVYVLAGDPAGGYLALTAALFDSRAPARQTCWGGGDFAADRHLPRPRRVREGARLLGVSAPGRGGVRPLRRQSAVEDHGGREPGPLASPVAEDRRNCHR